MLPRYRGAAPIAWAIMRGETETGITTFQMDPGMDTGDMLLIETTPIGPEETAGELSTRMAEIGARLLLRTLEGVATLPRIPQDHAKATLAPRLKKEDGWLRPAEPARDLVNRVRGCNPWPGAALMTPAGRLLVWRATALAAPGVTAPAGTPRPAPERQGGTSPSPPATACSSRSRSSRRTARRCRGPISSAARACRPARALTEPAS